jgi:hypothetical protein
MTLFMQGRILVTKKKKVSMYLEEDLLKKAKVIATLEGKRLSNWVESIIREKVEQKDMAKLISAIEENTAEG